MIGDLRKEMTAALSLKKPIFTHAHCQLSEVKPTFFDIFGTRNCSFFYVRYAPSTKQSGLKKPYIIMGDAFFVTRSSYKCVRVSGYEDLVEAAKTNKELAWVVRNTAMCPEIFEIAKANVRTAIPVAFDAVKYARKIQAHKNDWCVFRAPEEERAERLKLKAFLDERGVAESDAIALSRVEENDY